MQDRHLYKAVLIMLKVIPMIIAGVCLANTILSCFDIDWSLFSYIVFWLMLSFLYLASYTFKLCAYHRMFLHYVAADTLICCLDYEYGLPIDNWHYIVLHFIVSGVFLFLVLWYHQKQRHVSSKKT